LIRENWFSNTHEAVEGELYMRMCFPQELHALLKYNGFTIEAKFDNDSQAAFDSKSEKQLVVGSASE
jgi:hypothetical protein